MKKTQLLVVKIFICLASFSQNLSEEEKRNIATDLIADVFFDSKATLIRNQRKAFEDEHGIKLHFKVEDASLDQLGGLSEHLFKIFQTFTTPQNTNAKTITAEFSALENDVLSEKLSYKTFATEDLRVCRLPQQQTNSLDSLYNSYLSNSFLGEVENTQLAPVQLDDVYSDATIAYGNILYHNATCPGLFDAASYNQHVLNTRGLRSSEWTTEVNNISLQLTSSIFKLELNGLAGINGGANNRKIQLGINRNPLNGEYVINLNNSVNACTKADMEVRSRMLFAKTGIHYFFVTATLPFYLPLDSLDAFRDAALKKFEEDNGNKNLIVALYLEMKDFNSPSSQQVFLVKQNGNWLTNGDINFARSNNGGGYRQGTYSKYKNLFRNIPKPLIMCYQVAKVNGLLTTAYIERAQAVKGSEQMYYHSFVMDKAFDEIKELRAQYQILDASFDTEGANQAYISSRKTEVSDKIKVAFLKAARNPKFQNVDIKFKEEYLQSSKSAQAFALKHIDANYPDFFNSTAAKDTMNVYSLPSDLAAGTCESSEQSDVIANTLAVSSLLLMPTGLDVIPDALSAIYFTITDNRIEQALAIVSLVAPGSISMLKRAISGTGDAVTSANKGEQLVQEGQDIKAISQDADEIATVFKIDPAEFDNAFIQNISAKKQEVQSLLTTEQTKSKIYSHVSEKLEPAKRKEFVNKFLDDVDFRNKVLADPDEVLRWGGVMKIVVTNVDQIKHLLITENGTAFFWSGRTNGIGGANEALEIARAKNGITLEGLLVERNIELPTWDASNPNVVKIWEDVSAEFAKSVSGEVRAVIGQELRAGNIWESKELNALISNTQVTKITKIDPLTLVETIIFTR